MYRCAPYRIVTAAALAVLVMLACAWSSPVRAEVNRCVLPSGEHVYTDRRCDDVGAIQRRSRTNTPNTAASRLYHGDCAHSLRDLSWQMANAIDSRDVNALAALYHWPGMSTSRANATMRRLDAIVQRPLVDIVTVFADRPVTSELHRPTALDEARIATGLRVRQTLANTTTPSQTEFGLRRHMSCWWLQF